MVYFLFFGSWAFSLLSGSALEKNVTLQVIPYARSRWMQVFQEQDPSSTMYPDQDLSAGEYGQA